MHDEHPHPLLAQLPLTVSPFLSLPTAVPLPYTYTHLPSSLPPSVLQNPPAQPPQNANSSSSSSAEAPPPPPQPAYILSATGNPSTPDALLSSCLALQAHLEKLESDARRTLAEWEEKRRKEELAEKRRVAPGWLDGEVKLLKPENVDGEGEGEPSGVQGSGAEAKAQREHGRRGGGEHGQGVAVNSEAEALDRAFGGMDLK